MVASGCVMQDTACLEMQLMIAPHEPATASYRLLPVIQIKEEIPSHLCDDFAKCFSPGVMKVTRDSAGTCSVQVEDARKDTLSREVLRHAEFRDRVNLGRKRDHYICKCVALPSTRHHSETTAWPVNVESAGQYAAVDLVPSALEVLLSKIKVLQAACDVL